MNETLADVRARQTREHREKYEALAEWLGLDAVRALVPFPADQIAAALAAGDEHLNTLPLASWDRQHGESKSLERCACCQQWKPRKEPFGMRALFRAAWQRQRERREPMPPEYPRGWSLSDTVCTLKHVARYHMGANT